MGYRLLSEPPTFSIDLFCGLMRRLKSLGLPPMEAESLSTVAVDGGQIVYRRVGSGRPLLVLNGLAATSSDWDPSFIDRLASSHELILLNNRGIGGSTDDGQPFDIAKLADDAARVIGPSGSSGRVVGGLADSSRACIELRGSR